MFVLFLLVTVAVAVPLLIWSELSTWAVLVAAPIASYAVINVFGFVVDLIERRQKPYKGSYPGEKEVSLEFPEKAKEQPLVLPEKPEDLSCPSCGSQSIAAILYGLPAMSEELNKAVENREVTLGGCVVHEEAPRWACNACGHKFGTLATVERDQSFT